ncbi:hypothetical protein KCU81_g1784, partial [Aureobasidium melanogenum]
METEKAPTVACVLALMRALSPETTEAFEHPANNPMMDDLASIDSQSPIMKIDFQSLSGRTCIVFGSSRSCEMVFPEADQVDPHHFVIHLEPRTGILLVTDRSRAGTRISDGTWMESGRLLRGETWPLIGAITLSFGRNDVHQMRLVIPSNRRRKEQFEQLLKRYTWSVGKSGPASTAMQFLDGQGLWLNDTLVPIHHVNAGSFGAVSTCLPRQCARREVGLLMKLDHKHIIKCFTAGAEAMQQDLFLMDFFAGGTLTSMLDSLLPQALDIPSAQALICQSLDALRYINSHDLIHHDIKPDNILLRRADPIDIVLCDFGIAEDAVTVLAEDENGKGYDFAGTPGYMAPEFGTRKHSFGVDVWALGVVLLNALQYWPWTHLDPTDLPVYSHLPCASLLEGMLAHHSHRLTPSACLLVAWDLPLASALKRGRIEDTSSSSFPESKRARTGSSV